MKDKTEITGIECHTHFNGDVERHVLYLKKDKWGRYVPASTEDVWYEWLEPQLDECINYFNKWLAKT